MSKHTPGPWAVHSTLTVISVRAPKGVVARMAIAANSVHREQGFADAQFIAAAPQMYEELVKVRDFLQADIDVAVRHTDENPEGQAWISKAKKIVMGLDAALKAADGEGA